MLTYPSPTARRPLAQTRRRASAFAVSGNSCMERLTLGLGFPVTGKTLRLCDLRRAHLCRDIVAAFGGIGAGVRIGTAHNRDGEPLEGLDGITGEPKALGVQAGEPDLGKRIALLGRSTIPRRCWCIFFSRVVEAGEIELGVGVALLGSLAKPRRRHCLVVGNAEAVQIKRAKPRLRVGI